MAVSTQSPLNNTLELERFEENSNEILKSSTSIGKPTDDENIIGDHHDDKTGEVEVMHYTAKSALRSKLIAYLDSEETHENTVDSSQSTNAKSMKCVDIDKDQSEDTLCCANVNCQLLEYKNQNCSLTCKNVDDNLDVAVQKLENMRLNDKTKHESSNVNRKNLLNDGSMSNNDVVNAIEGSKSPSSTAPQLNSPLPSKARKRKLKKKLKANQNKSAVNDSSICKLKNGDVTSETTAEIPCDANKNIKTCSSRTCSTDSKDEKICVHSQKRGDLCCNLKESDECDLKVIENHQKDCDNERDSANYSPVDTILDCQSVQFSDTHSERSSDSGKGCSECAVFPSPQTPAGGSSISGDQNMILLFQFAVPQEHVGKLIGRHGQFINSLKANSNTRIYIKKHPTSFTKKICALEGTQADINKALELIRIRFPEDSYSGITLEEFPISQPIACPLRSELFQLDLVEGVNNDVIVSSVVSAGHLFLQQPMHPTHQSLTLLNMNMNHVYNSPEAPIVLKPMKDNIVVAPAMGGWYRAQITAVDKEMETCDVRFLDYGGYLTLSITSLRAVRADFLSLPFQAVDCFLANITPINDKWCEDAKLVVQGLTYGRILQAQVYDYTPEGIPLVLLFGVHGSQIILINDELVARGYAYPVVQVEGTQSEEYYINS